MPKDTFINLSEEKQEKVMRSAISEFVKNGFEKGNITSIAKEAGVATGSMYQYFENKKELFLYSVRWGTELIMKKSDKYMSFSEKNINVFDYFYQTSRELVSQLRADRDVVVFMQDVFLGKYRSMTDESMAYMMKAVDQSVLRLIKNGKDNGYIRKDIDDNILILFMTGASIKIKEYLINKARNAGEDLIDEEFEKNEKDIKAMLELIKNGMGAK